MHLKPRVWISTWPGKVAWATNQTRPKRAVQTEIQGIFGSFPYDNRHIQFTTKYSYTSPPYEKEHKKKDREVQF
jgi:hypothetical protein